MALLSCLCAYTHLFAGLTNRSLRELVAGLIPGYSARQMTYDLRRLRRKGLIRRVPRSQRYELTDHGRRIAVFFTKTYTRIINPALAELDPALPDEIAARSALARAWQAFEHALDARIADAALTPMAQT
jgi:Mn-dependent DtxR family transcriptional regulator